MFEPIDYVAFKGLSAKSSIDAVVFIDVKSGAAGLQGSQRQIKRTVEERRVTFEVVDPPSASAK